MTQTLATDKFNNDLYIDNTTGNIAVVYGVNAVMQACEHAAKTRLGEMVLNTDQGIPYFETVWNGVPNIQQFDAALRRAFLQVADVTEIVSLVLTQTPGTDILLYTAIIRTTFGVGTITNG